MPACLLESWVAPWPSEKIKISPWFKSNFNISPISCERLSLLHWRRYKLIWTFFLIDIEYSFFAFFQFLLQVEPTIRTMWPQVHAGIPLWAEIRQVTWPTSLQRPAAWCGDSQREARSGKVLLILLFWYFERPYRKSKDLILLLLLCKSLTFHGKNSLN